MPAAVVRRLRDRSARRQRRVGVQAGDDVRLPGRDRVRGVLQHRPGARAVRAHRTDERQVLEAERHLQHRRHLGRVVGVDQQPVDVVLAAGPRRRARARAPRPRSPWRCGRRPCPSRSCRGRRWRSAPSCRQRSRRRRQRLLEDAGREQRVDLRLRRGRAPWRRSRACARRAAAPGVMRTGGIAPRAERAVLHPDDPEAGLVAARRRARARAGAGPASWSSGRIIIAAGTPAACSRSITARGGARARPVGSGGGRGARGWRCARRRWRTSRRRPIPGRRGRAAAPATAVVAAHRDDAPLVVAGARVDAPRRAVVVVPSPSDVARKTSASWLTISSACALSTYAPARRAPRAG